MSLVVEILKTNNKISKLLPETKMLNKEAKASLNELGILELKSQDGEVRLSYKGVQELYKTLNEWYGELLFKSDSK